MSSTRLTSEDHDEHDEHDEHDDAHPKMGDDGEEEDVAKSSSASAKEGAGSNGKAGSVGGDIILGMPASIFWFLVAITIVLVVMLSLWFFIFSMGIKNDDHVHRLELQVTRIEGNMEASGQKMVRNVDDMERARNQLQREMELLNQRVDSFAAYLASVPTYSMLPASTAYETKAVYEQKDASVSVSSESESASASSSVA